MCSQLSHQKKRLFLSWALFLFLLLGQGWYNCYAAFCNELGLGATTPRVESAGGTALRLENGTSGRVEVCWEGQWREVLEGAVKTTQQASSICKLLNFLPEGDILESVEARNLNATCWLGNVNSLVLTVNCSQDLMEAQAAVIKCKRESVFSTELQILVIVTPLLLGVILVGGLVIIHLTARLNATKKQEEEANMPQQHKVETTKCVAYEPCAPGNQDGDLFEEDAVRSFRSIDQGLHFLEDTQLSLPQQTNSKIGNETFESLEASLNLKSRSLEQLPTYKDKNHEFAVASATDGIGMATPKPLLTTAQQDNHYKNIKPLSAHSSDQLEKDVTPNPTTKPLLLVHKSNRNEASGGGVVETSYGFKPFSKHCSAVSLRSLVEKEEVVKTQKKWEILPMLLQGRVGLLRSQDRAESALNDSAGYVQVDC